MYGQWHLFFFIQFTLIKIVLNNFYNNHIFLYIFSYLNSISPNFNVSSSNILSPRYLPTRQVLNKLTAPVAADTNFNSCSIGLTNASSVSLFAKIYGLCPFSTYKFVNFRIQLIHIYLIYYRKYLHLLFSFPKEMLLYCHSISILYVPVVDIVPLGTIIT